MNLVSDLLNVTSSPHVRDKMDTQKIMALVVISLLPASIFGICNFGLHALVLILVTIDPVWLLNGSTRRSYIKRAQSMI